VKAALYTSHGLARDVLRVEEVERPEPGPGDVRVRVRVSGGQPDRPQVPKRDGAEHDRRVDIP
jgi:NADPH2:quinone reductase